MIKSFKHKGLEKYFNHNIRKYLDAKDLPRIERILDRLDTATTISDMNIPGWRLHELKGNRKNGWSITVSANRRITFCFENGKADDVNLEDYH